MPAVFATGRCGRHATRQNPSPRRPTEARVQLLLCPTAILADARLTPTEFARTGHRHSHHAVIRCAIPMGPCVNRAGGGRASVPHCGCRLPAIYYEPGLVPADEELWFRPKFPKPAAPALSPAKGAGSLRALSSQGVRRRAVPVPAADAGDPSPAPSGPAPRLHSGLGLTKGAKKNKATPSP